MYTYIGSYVECKTTKKMIVELHRCSNAECEQHTLEWQGDAHGVCDKCRSSIEAVNVERTVDVGVDPRKLSGTLTKMDPDYRFSFHQNGWSHIWLGKVEQNDGGNRPCLRFSANDDGTVIELPPGVIERHIVLFKHIYQEDLARLGEAYGPRNVSVKWGIIHRGDDEDEDEDEFEDENIE